MSDASSKEYAELRRTIRERGTLRVIVFVITLVGWAVSALATQVLADRPDTWLVSWLVLVGGFEAVYGLHTGVERIGRYLYVFHERRQGPGWETVITQFGQRPLTRGTDPLFTYIFALAAIINVTGAFGQGRSLATFLVALAHAAFAGRLVVARRRVARQREVDQAAFEAIAASVGGAPTT